MLYVHALYLLLRALCALWAQLGHAAHTLPAPVRAPRPPVTTSAMGPQQAMASLLRMVQAHHGRVLGTGSYGYGAHPGQYTARNAGVWVQVGPGKCVGYETYGAPGYFGNMYGLSGGDCS